MLHRRRDKTKDWESVTEVGSELSLRARKTEDRNYKDRNVLV